MAKYIDCDAAIALAKDIIVPTKSGHDYRHRCIDPQELAELPAADVVERKVGKWLFWQDDPDANVYECSACHEPLTLNEGTPRENNFNFCPFCGLPMIGGDDDV